MVQGDINRGRHTGHLAGRHSIQVNEYPLPPSPIVFKFGVQINIDEYYCMYDKLPQGSHDLFKFWEITGSFLETVQNSIMVRVEGK